MPAFNAEKTLEKTYLDLPKGMFDGVILVDDASADKTVQVADRLGLIVVKHDKNRGYGGNQKTCYKTALGIGADIIVMVHPDHQYDPKFIPEMIEAIISGGYSAVFGSRLAVRKNALAGGMPKWKFVFNIILTFIGNFFLGTKLAEFHSGFRAYGKEIFKQIDIERNSDNFVFDTQIIIQLVEKNIAIKEIPITTRYFKGASQIGIWPSVIYGFGILYNIFLYKFKLKKF
ncbi:MAG: family 2 glycosyl transferase [Parcubacteria group bacterium GW2011_GWC2_42_12]|nr:MAG: family 2 glycosyl transferase [Parcubacteria group bacterium GW2011_GWC2_42_12]